MRSRGWVLVVALLAGSPGTGAASAGQPELRCGGLAPFGWNCEDPGGMRLDENEALAGLVPEVFVGHVTIQLLKVGSNGLVGLRWECDAVVLGQAEVPGTGLTVPLTTCEGPFRHGDLGPGDRLQLYCETSPYRPVTPVPVVGLGPVGKWSCFVDLVDDD